MSISISPASHNATNLRMAEYSSGVDFAHTAASSNGISIRLLPHSQPFAKRGRNRALPRVVRRLNGFLIQEEGEECRVAFIENGKLIHYYLPSKLLSEAGVVVENQPFEMDELESEYEGVVLRGHKITPSAKPADSYQEALSLDDKTKHDLDFILAKFKDA